MQYLLLFLYNNSCTNAPELHVYTYIARFIIILRSEVRGEGNLSCAATIRDALIDVAK